MATRSSRKRRNADQPPQLSSAHSDKNDGNIVLNYKRGESAPDHKKILRQLELLRSNETIITCCDYGMDRENIYSAHFFCANCKKWEDRARENKKIHRAMKKYKCTVEHSSFLSPSKKTSSWCPSRIPVTPILDPNKTVDSLLLCSSLQPSKKDVIDDFKLKLKNLRAQVSYLEDKVETNVSLLDEMRTERKTYMRKISTLQSKLSNVEVSEAPSLWEALEIGISSVLNSTKYCRLGAKKVAAAINDACWCVKNGVARKENIKRARKYLRGFVFTPQNVLKALDLAGGVCNLKAYTVIRSVELVSKDPYKFDVNNDSVLPHEWRVRQASEKVHEYADAVIPMKHHVSNNGECVEFSDVKDVTIKICDAFGLSEVAKRRPIDMALTLDGAQLTNKLSFVMAGLKLVDLAVRNPLTGEFELDPDAEGSKYLPQSRKWCFPLKLCMGKETKQMYQEEFASIFQLFSDASVEGQDIFPDWEAINFSNPADMAAIMKVLGFGGAAKVWRFFCHCCSLVSNKIATPNEGDAICGKCQTRQSTCSTWKCYCQPFSGAEQTKKYEDALDELTTTWNHDMELVNNEGTLKLGLENNKKSVSFVPNNDEEGLVFTRLLMKEMRLRGRSTLGKNLNQIQAELKESLEAEKRMSQLIDQISQSSTREQAMERIMTFVPCIMHCENRVCIKILTMIVIEGLSNYQGARFPDLAGERSMAKREKMFIDKIEKIDVTRR